MTVMALFENCSLLLELKYLSYKEKKKVQLAVTENGGNIAFVVNKQCSLVVTSDVANLSSNRLRSIHKHQIPVVGVDYVYCCVERGVRLPVDEYKLDTSSTSTLPPPPLSSPKKTPRPRQVSVIHVVDETPQRNEAPQRSGNVLEKFRIYSETDSKLPSFPDRFHVAKYSIYEKRNSWWVLELQSSTGEKGRQYRVVRYWKEDAGAQKAAVRDMQVFLSSSEEALEVYQSLRDSLEASGLQKRSCVPPQAKNLGSAPLHQLLLEEKLNTGQLSEEVGVFVELLWTEALGCLNDILSVSIDKLSINDVSRAEGLLLQAQKKLRDNDYEAVISLLGEFYTLLPHKRQNLHPEAKLISQKLDLCQLIRDVVNVSEMTLRSPAPSCVGKYRALRCSIEPVPSNSSEFQAVRNLLQGSKVQIQQIVRVSRGVELQTFKSELGNIKPLLHSSSPSNFVGILSRGLLLPRVGVEHHGIERTDVGNLGSGIYFGDTMSTSLKYSKPSVTDGSRLLLVCDVALGRCRDVHQRDTTLTQAPEGHHSMHGVRRTANAQSDFEDDEYVVYSTDQVRLKYVVQFSIEGDQRKDFSPDINTSAELCLPPSSQDFGSEDNGVEHVKNPMEDVKAGLLNSSGQQLPLQAVHVKCKLMDLLSQVVIFQKYTNQSSEAIEAKYVFPLDDSAAVCGFEAFINGKHVVGQVKEKEKARKEYKQAIEKGYGAYLMDQDAPDVFTISVGNLPPGATVLIKITYVSELMVRDGSILFSLPGSVAPWQESAALNQTTQVTVEKVCVTDKEAGRREFTLDASVEMPYEISSLQCVTHKVKMKRTDCKAVVSVLPGEVLGPDGFQLNITLSEVHLPRMWVENHPDKDSQACMLVFYPNFEVDSGSAADEVILLLDTSESMRGESLQEAQRIALQVLKVLDNNVRLNVILFGTGHTDAFLTAKPLSEVHQAARSFIKRCSSVGGSTELWRPLRALSLLPPSRGVRNLLLLSDGHIQNAELTLQLLRDNSQHSRLFSCGLSPTANRHMLRALAQAGGGAYEFFDTKTKHNWAEKVARQLKRMASPGCSSVSVKWQQFNPSAPPPVQAPKQLHALFSDCHTLVYGFVPHCTQATLVGNLSGQELKTMVSTSELQKTRGTFLHKLTARALIRDYEDGSLDTSEAGHEGKKVELKSFIVQLSKEFSILSQFTSFVAIEERDSEQAEDGFTDIPKLIAEEDVDFLSYMSFSHDDDTDSDFFKSALLKDLPIPRMARFPSSLSDDEQALTSSSDDDEVEPLEFGDYDGECALMSADKQYGSFLPSLQTLEVLDLPSTPVIALGMSPVIKRDRPPPPPPPLPHPVVLGFHSFPGSPPPPPPPRPPRPPYPGPPPPLATGDSRAVRSCRAKSMVARAIEPVRKKGRRSSRPILPPPRGTVIPTSFGAIMSSTDALDLSQQLEICSRPLSGRRSSPAPPAAAPEISEALPLFCRSSSLDGSFSEGAPLVPQQMLEAQGVPSFDAAAAPPSTVETGSGFQFGALFGSSRSSAASSSRGAAPVHQIPEDVLSRVRVGGCRSLAARGRSLAAPPAPVPLMLEAPIGYAAAPQPTLELGSGFQFGALFGSSSSSAASSNSGASPVLRRRPEINFLKERMFLDRSSRSHERERQLCFRMSSAAPEPTPNPKWIKIFQMQHSEGYWELTEELGELININVDVFANVFLKNKGIRSLGVRAHADILRLVATLLVLQLMRLEMLEEGKLLSSLFRLELSEPRPQRWLRVKTAVDWVSWADRQYPSIYSRLEFGQSWESATRQLLGYERLPHFSPLSGLDLHRTTPLLLVH
ncbi:protein mono-ADP-ribosyltransferase PARP4 isoform X5 [Mugil cephalus]|uniref:protein mono-ADP-ribosyltransferase PARP4 isoform X5 n=1 Tax=Mugil cephalus TaxID=48193 RepID=UPI001FB5782B|nr:protein mono-ADP-ribosyltransferase PARP4 isoform X5 [Mugil cephalus]